MNPYSFSENLLAALKKLKLLLEKQRTPYMLIGGIAVALWGEPRATQDIDIVVLIPKDRAFDFLEEAMSLCSMRSSGLTNQRYSPPIFFLFLRLKAILWYFVSGIIKSIIKKKSFRQINLSRLAFRRSQISLS